VDVDNDDPVSVSVDAVGAIVSSSDIAVQTVSVVAVAADVWCCKPGKHEVMGMHTVSLVGVAAESWYCVIEHTVTSSQMRKLAAVLAVSQRLGRSSEHANVSLLITMAAAGNSDSVSTSP
jgi:hypothetical protein